MKKILQSILTLAVIFSFSSASMAQVPDFTYAEDFTVTDINGVEHNLYSYLDAGKYVLIDVSATWCGPCWAYHQTHNLADVHDTYGPEGTDEMVVIFVEGDITTTADDLAGTGSSTQGNWLEGTPYPIIDGEQGAALADYFAITAYPSFFTICPNRMIFRENRYADGDFVQHYEKRLTAGCLGAATQENEAAILTYNQPENEFCSSEVIVPELTIQNAGSSPTTSVVVEMLVNGEVRNSVTVSEELGLYELANVGFPLITLNRGEELSFSITEVNGVENTGSNASYTTAYKAGEIVESLVLVIKTDEYPCETYWSFTDTETNEVVASGGNAALTTGGAQISGSSCPGAYAGNSTNTEEISLEEGKCYEFKVIDDWGDGIFVDNAVILYDAEGNVVRDFSDFLVEGQAVYLNDISSSTQDINGTTITTAPNPTNGSVQIEMIGEGLSDITVEVFSANGQLMMSNLYDGLQHNLNLDLNAFNNGLYLIQVTSDNQTLTSKVVLSK